MLFLTFNRYAESNGAFAGSMMYSCCAKNDVYFRHVYFIFCHCHHDPLPYLLFYSDQTSAFEKNDLGYFPWPSSIFVLIIWLKCSSMLIALFFIMSAHRAFNTIHSCHLIEKKLKEEKEYNYTTIQ